MRSKLKKHTSSNYAILIPARYESKIIRNLLDSIKVQNKDMSNVYVIIEDKKDPTFDICKEYNANVFIRKKPIRRKKGYALDECFKYILKHKKYDLYFIFDADNTLDKHFIKIMLKSWKEGYDVAAGYRNISNPVNVISGCSILLFAFVNSVMNKVKLKSKQTIIACGTGFYVSDEIIRKLNGFPFFSFAEDYEFSVYMNRNKISSTYNEDAMFYDEQPTKMKTSIKQRNRWTKGILQVRRKYLKEGKWVEKLLTGTILTGIIIAVIYLVLIILSIVKNQILIIEILSIPIFLYLVLFLSTLLLLIKDKNKINMSLKLKIKCMFFNPFFLVTYIYCFFKSMTKLDWEVIEHNGKHIK